MPYHMGLTLLATGCNKKHLPYSVMLQYHLSMFLGTTDKTCTTD